MGRAPCCDKTNVKKGPWSPEEDARLKDFIQEHGTGGNWIALPQKIGLKRCGKSCRLRWLNYLRPNLRHGAFSEEEDQIICSLYISIGSRWSIIAAQLPGRTDNDIKNYWNTKLKKKLLGGKRSQFSSRINHNQDDQEGDGSSHEPPPMSASALERIQLHMQLQGLHNHNPLSFYNHPALWPKVHPLCDPLIFENNPIPLIDREIPNTMVDVNIGEGFDSAMLHFSPNEVSDSKFGLECQMGSSCLISDGNGCFGRKESDQIADLGCFKEMNLEERSMNWWGSNNFDEKTSLACWGSDSAIQPDVMLQEYIMGYDL